MKRSQSLFRLTGILILILGSISVFAQKSKTTIKTAVIKTTIYCDHCKECETCGDKFQKDLYNENGIRRVDVDPKLMTITVIYDSRKIELDTIRQLISTLGYDADDIKADPVALSKLDGCCKKE